VENVIEVLSCDVGYFSVKAAYRLRGYIETFSFPSVTIRSTRESLRSSTEFLGKNESRVEVGVGSTTYVIDTSNSSLPSSAAVRAEIDNFPVTEEYTALTLASVKKTRASRIRCLVLGLPIHTMTKHASYLKSRFEAVHHLDDNHICVVEKVVVLPQPLGSFAMLRAQNIISPDRTANTCIVDVGWHTTDAIVIGHDGSPDLERSVGLPGGAARVVREVARLVTEKTGVRIENLDRVDFAIRTRKPLLLAGAPIDLGPFLSLASKDTTHIANAVLTGLKTAEDLQVYATGGGGTLYVDAFSQAMGFPVTLVERGQMANALGFLIAAEAATRKLA
jgi:plasmid segregation protein ParM